MVLELEFCGMVWRQAVSNEKCLDVARAAWSDPENDGALVVLSTPSGLEWWFNPEVAYAEQGRSGT